MIKIDKAVFCPYPWVHFSVHTDGGMRVCCNSTTDGGRISSIDGTNWKMNQINDVIDYYNSRQLVDLRKDMLSGKRNSLCASCYKLEDNGGVSVRSTQLKNYNIEELLSITNLITGELTESKIKSLDLSWGNKCNLKCKMCTPSASDQLYDEWETFGYKFDKQRLLKISTEWKFESNIELFNELYMNIEEILVTGGEPLINNDFYKLCLFLIEKDVAKNILLKFHTNLTVTPKKFINVWKKFKKVLINCSIDGTEDTYEYIRYPGKWSIIQNNFEELYNYSKVAPSNLIIDVHTVFSAFNAHNISEIVYFFAKYDIFPYFNRVEYPSYIDSRRIPNFAKLLINEKGTKMIEKYTNSFKNHWSNIKVNTLKSNLDIMLSENLSTNEFYDFVDRQDAMRTVKSSEVLFWYKK